VDAGPIALFTVGRKFVKSFSVDVWWLWFRSGAWGSWWPNSFYWL